MSSSIADVAEKLVAGKCLTEVDVDAIITTHDLLAVGMLADDAKRRRHGERVTFVRVAELSMVPVATMDPRQPVPPEAVPGAAGELRIVGRPPSLDAACAFVRGAASLSGGRPVTGFLLHEVEELCASERTPLEGTLARLRDAGLDLIAEAQVDRVADPERALSAAGRAQLGVARLTIHSAADAERSAWIRRVAACQAAAGVVRAFAPLPRVSTGSWPSTGYDDVKQVALARLLVDNIDSIQVDWTLHGPKLAQVALTFGADDVDAVSAADAPDKGSRRAALAEVRRNIEAAAFIPLERNGRFEVMGP